MAAPARAPAAAPPPQTPMEPCRRPNTVPAKRVPFLLMCIPAPTTHSQASLTVMKTLPREEAAGKAGPGLHCLPKAAAPKLSLHSAVARDTPTRPQGLARSSASARRLSSPLGDEAHTSTCERTPRGCMVGGPGRDSYVQTTDSHLGATSSPGDIGHCLETSGCHKWGLPLAHSEWRPGMQLDTLQCTGWSPRHKCQ